MGSLFTKPDPELVALFKRLNIKKSHVNPFVANEVTYANIHLITREQLQQILPGKIGPQNALYEEIQKLKNARAQENTPNNIDENAPAQPSKFFKYVEFSNIKELASGQFGTIFTAWQQGEMPLVIKAPSNGELSSFRELQAMENLPPHKHTMPLVGLCLDFEFKGMVCPGIVMPVQYGGTLLRTTKIYPELLDLVTVVCLAEDMAVPVLHFHDNNYLHGDIALRNYLLKEKGLRHKSQLVILADYGLCRHLRCGQSNLRITDGQIPWMWCAPESLAYDMHSKSSDVYMLGVTIWELICHKQPFSECLDAKNAIPPIRRKLEFLRQCKKEGRPALEVPKKFMELQEIVNKCCEFDIRKRCSARDVVTFMKKMKTCDLADKVQDGLVHYKNCAPGLDAEEKHFDVGSYMNTYKSTSPKPQAFALYIITPPERALEFPVYARNVEEDDISLESKEMLRIKSENSELRNLLEVGVEQKKFREAHDFQQRPEKNKKATENLCEDKAEQVFFIDKELGTWTYDYEQ